MPAAVVERLALERKGPVGQHGTMTSTLPRRDCTLRTERLSLQVPVATDLEASAAMWADPAVVRFIGGRSLSREEAWHRLLRHVGHWTLLGFGFWTIRETETELFVGEIGFANFERDDVPNLGDAPECGWVLASWAQGRGYASEALAAVLAWGDQQFGGPRTVCIIDPENRPSIRLAQRFDYAQFGHGDYKGKEYLLLERTRPPGSG